MRITRQDELRAHFGSDRIDLAPGAAVTLAGAITVGSEVIFEGEVSLGPGTEVGNGCLLTDVTLGTCNRVRPFTILYDIVAGDRNLFGPFAFLRDGCTVANDCILGAHVEAARSGFASGVKVSHHAFIGDAEVGEATIVGAGVVFCNYDGRARQATLIGAGVTLGSGTLLIPPLTIGNGALIAAGSTVTRDIAPGARLIQKRDPVGF